MGVKVWRGLALLCLLPIIVGCAVVDYADTPVTIGLLAPFEGRYRDVGYDALYAARLALADADGVRLLPIDDGGTPATAAERVQAFHADVSVLIVLGYAATDAGVDYGSLPTIIVGGWGKPAGDAVVVLSSAEIGDLLTIAERTDLVDAEEFAAPLTGPDVLALPGFAAIRDDLDGVTVVSSGTLPDDAYIARILESDPFASEPGLLSTLVYDATALAFEAIHTGQSLDAITYTGLNGSIQFGADGWWRDAPVNRYEFDDEGRLIAS